MLNVHSSLTRRKGRVYLIGDDGSLVGSLERLLWASAFSVATFTSVVEFLLSAAPSPTGCIILDIGVSRLRGFELYEGLTHWGSALPVVLLCDDGLERDLMPPMGQESTRFLKKPFRAEELLAAVASAVERSELPAPSRTYPSRSATFGKLSTRERQVGNLVAEGLPNKQIAGVLMIAEKTVKNHRASLMRKLGAHSAIELVKLMDPQT